MQALVTVMGKHGVTKLRLESPDRNIWNTDSTCPIKLCGCWGELWQKYPCDGSIMTPINILICMEMICDQLGDKSSFILILPHV